MRPRAISWSRRASATGGSIAGLSAVRTFISRLLVLLARLAFPSRLHGVTDPLTGFFLVRRDALDLAILRPQRLQDPARDPRPLAEARGLGDSLRLRRPAGRREQGLRTGGRALSRAGLAPPPRHAGRALRPLRPRRVERHRRQLGRARGIPRRIGLQRARGGAARDPVLVDLELRPHRTLRLRRRRRPPVTALRAPRRSSS